MFAGGSHEKNNACHISKVDSISGSAVLENYGTHYNSATESCLLVNLYGSEGKQGKVLEVRAKQRIGIYRSLLFHKMKFACVSLVLKSAARHQNAMQKFHEI